MMPGQVSLSVPIATVLQSAIPLEVAVEFQRFCDECLKEERFVSDRLCVVGLIGRCSKCGEQWIAPFTHTTSEVA